MESTLKYLLIDGKTITAEEKDIPQCNLFFYPENPRIKSIIDAECGENPSQQAIESKMKSLENVKELRRSIIANAGLLEPIIVKNNVVLEGNSRLAAYRLLCETDPVKWGKIRAIVLPPDTTEDAIFSMLGTLHIVGKTPWSPFEQAGYLQRRITSSRRPIEAIANELGLSPSSAKLYIKTLEMMVDNNDAEPNKWSYYLEFAKNGQIKKAIESYPQYEIEETILEKIKNNEFPDSREIRKVGKIVSATNETAEEAIAGYLSGALTLEEGVELVENESKLTNFIVKTKSMTEYLVKNEESLREKAVDMALCLQLKQLKRLIMNILGE